MDFDKVEYGKIEVCPEEVGYDSTRIEALNRHFLRLIGERKLLGASYCIAKEGKIIANNAMGRISYREDAGSLHTETIHGIASVTKLFVATCVWKLVEDGKILLDEPMAKYIIEMDTAELREITIAQVLSHTSGMYADGGCFEDQKVDYWDEIDKLQQSQSGDLDWLRAALKIGCKRIPGTEWMYCSFGYALLGVLIQRVTGIHAERYIIQNIARPLGMKDTTFSLNCEQVERHMVLNEEAEKEMAEMCSGQWLGTQSVWSQVPNTAGGLHSTTADLIRFGNALCYGGRFFDVRILGRMAVEKMTSHYLTNIPDYTWKANNPSRSYGLGPDKRAGLAITVSDSFFFHEGWGACALAVDPREHLVAAWMVPFADTTQWFRDSLLNAKNVMWSGII